MVTELVKKILIISILFLLWLVVFNLWNDWHLYKVLNYYYPGTEFEILSLHKVKVYYDTLYDIKKINNGQWYDYVIIYNLPWLLVPIALPKLLFKKTNHNERQKLPDGGINREGSSWAKEDEINARGLFNAQNLPGVYLSGYTTGCPGKENGLSKNIRYLMDTTLNEHILVLGPSREGKGTGFVVPNLLVWGDSAIIYDPKGELWNLTSGWREAQGHNCIRLSFAEVWAKINPFSGIKANDPDARKAINTILTYLEDPKAKKDPFFSEGGKRFVLTIILYLIKSNKSGNLKNIAYMVSNYDVEKGKAFQIKTLLKEMVMCNDPDVKSEAQNFLDQFETEAFRNFMQNASLLLDIFKERILGEVTSESDFDLRELADINKKPTSLYIQLPPEETITDRMMRVVRLIFNTVIVESLYKTGLCHEVKKRSIGCFIDEFHQLGQFRPLERALSDIGGYGGKLMLITQGDKMIDIAYDGKHSFFTSMNHFVIFRSNDADTSQYFSKRLGWYEVDIPVETKTESIQNKKKSTSTTISMQRKRFDLLTTTELEALPTTDAVIISKGLKIYARKIDYRQDPELMRRASFGPAKRYNVIE